MASKVPRRFLDELTRQIEAVSSTYAEAARRELERLDWSDVARAREEATRILSAYASAAADASAMASAEAYDALREMQVGSRMGALALSGFSYGAIDGFVRATAQMAVDGRSSQDIAEALVSRIDWETKRAAGNSMYENGRHDKRKPRYARVPSGIDTCEFCIMLASLGFHYLSADSAGADRLDHYHANCRCRIVPQWGKGSVEGYDPSVYYKQWKALKDGKKGSVGVEVDELTPCLRRVSDGEIVKTSMVTVHPKAGEYDGWLFDWALPEKEGYEVRALLADGSDDVQGLVALKDNPRNGDVRVLLAEAAPHNNPRLLAPGEQKRFSGVGGHLFAEAARESAELGYNGFVEFTAKSGLVEHYTTELGATQIGSSQVMFIEEQAAERLIGRYYGDQL